MAIELWNGRNGGMAGMAGMAQMAKYVLFTVHTDTNTNTNNHDTLIFYSIETRLPVKLLNGFKLTFSPFFFDFSYFATTFYVPKEESHML